MADPAAELPLGARVVIRHRLTGPDPLSGATLNDVVGVLEGRDAQSLAVRTGRGLVRVDRTSVALAKVVPPRPTRRAAAHLALSVDDLQRVMLGAWGAVEREPLGDWRLRASAGFTHRGNSVAAIGSPGLPLADAVSVARRWYAARGLPLDVCLPGPVGLDPAGDPLGAVLLGAGSVRRSGAVTLTAPAALVADAAVADGPEVLLDETLTADWLAAYGRYRDVVPGATEAVLTGSPAQVFASVRAGGDAVALARLGLSDGWGGVAAVWVDPVARRRGLATAVTAALAETAVRHGVTSLHLQVEPSNTAAQNLYAAMGFVPHHECVNLGDPERRPNVC